MPFLILVTERPAAPLAIALTSLISAHVADCAMPDIACPVYVDCVYRLHYCWNKKLQQ